MISTLRDSPVASLKARPCTSGMSSGYGDYPEDLRSFKYRLMTCLNSTATSHGMAMELTRLHVVQ